jgi:CrcB protein
MDHPSQPRPDERAEAANGEFADPDLLDAAILPLLGLSVSSIVAVFIGGAIGTSLRYLLEVHHPAGPSGFPWPTLLANLTGSLAIGLVLPLTEHLAPRLPTLRPFLVVGVLGGWTTYSTLAVETTLLTQHGHVVTALAYVAATVVGGLALVVIGHGAGRRLVPA